VEETLGDWDSESMAQTIARHLLQRKNRGF